ncbi:MAG: replication initiation negative regulator SeqA [Aeromonas sp.]
MKTIELDDDLYLFIASQTRHIGESASDILRRLLAQPPSAPVLAAAPLLGVGEMVIPDLTLADVASAEVPVSRAAALEALLTSNALVLEGKSINRFMLILSTLYQTDTEAFISATQIKGRKRVYFSQDPEALRASGSTTKPKPVPNTPFWVITNTNTSRKQNMVTLLMTHMGYAPELTAALCAAI